MKYIKLSGNLYLIGQNGINRVEPLGEYDPKKKGNNCTVVYGPNFTAVVEETVDEIEALLIPSQETKYNGPKGLCTFDELPEDVQKSLYPLKVRLNCGCVITEGLNGHRDWCGDCLPF